MLYVPNILNANKLADYDFQPKKIGVNHDDKDMGGSQRDNDSSPNLSFKDL